jgi:hypothetical protein
LVKTRREMEIAAVWCSLIASGAVQVRVVGDSQEVIEMVVFAKANNVWCGERFGHIQEASTAARTVVYASFGNLVTGEHGAGEVEERGCCGSEVLFHFEALLFAVAILVFRDTYGMLSWHRLDRV